MPLTITKVDTTQAAESTLLLIQASQPCSYTLVNKVATPVPGVTSTMSPSVRLRRAFSNC